MKVGLCAINGRNVMYPLEINDGLAGDHPRPHDVPEHTVLGGWVCLLQNLQFIECNC